MDVIQYTLRLIFIGYHYSSYIHKHYIQLLSTRRIISTMGRVYTVGFPFTITFTSAFRTWPSELSNVFRTNPVGHRFRSRFLSLRRITSPLVMSRWTSVYFCLCWSNGRYSFLQRAQNILDKACTRFHSALYKSRSEVSPSALALNS